MLAPGVTLHVYGIEQKIPLSHIRNISDLVGIIDDQGWNYLVFTRPAQDDLDKRGISTDYQATLPYEQWLDGDTRSPMIEAGITIVPPWCQVPESTENFLLIDPALAFGTGAHPTTRRCLNLMAEIFSSSKPPESVLDLGCGTGLLGLAALRFGARRLWACDISEHAIGMAQKNADQNHLRDQATFVRCPASEMIRPADFVLANLPPAALGELLAHPSMKSARFLIASGMLSNDFQKLEDHLPDDLSRVESFVDGFWHTALLCRDVLPTHIETDRQRSG